MTIWRMHIPCWLRNAANTHSEYLKIIAFTPQRWLHERASKLRYTYIVCLVNVFCDKKKTLEQRHYLAC